MWILMGEDPNAASENPLGGDKAFYDTRRYAAHHPARGRGMCSREAKVDHYSCPPLT